MSQFPLYVFKVKAQLLEESPAALSVGSRKLKEHPSEFSILGETVNRIGHHWCCPSSDETSLSIANSSLKGRCCAAGRSFTWLNWASRGPSGPGASGSLHGLRHSSRPLSYFGMAERLSVPRQSRPCTRLSAATTCVEMLEVRLLSQVGLDSFGRNTFAVDCITSEEKKKN